MPSSHSPAIPRVALRRPRPASIEAYVDTFGVQPTFGVEHHELVFASESLECAVRGADLELGRILQQHLTDLVARAEPSDTLLHRLRSELTRRLESGSLELPDVASALAMSERTLRRRLATRETSYQKVLDELRSELACQLLEQNQPVRAVALALGFRSVSAFQKAFVRWKSLSPSEYRKSRRRV